MIRVSTDGLIFKMVPNGGIARYWLEVFKAMSHLKHPVQFNVASPKGALQPSDVQCFTSGSLASYWAAWRADIFHSTYYTQWPRMSCPSVATVYDFIDASFPQLRPRGATLVKRQMESIRHASAVVAISETTRDLTLKLTGINPSDIFLAYPGVSTPFTQARPEAAEIRKFRDAETGGAPYLLHVGGCENYKNFRTILKAFCRIATKTDRHLVVVGRGQLLAADEIDWIVASRAMERIHFKLHVDDATLRLAYAGADAMVHASLMEGFGIPVIEALACGTGLILSDIPVYREIAGGMATFVDAVDVEAWAQALQAPVDVQSTWRDEVLKRYTWDAAALAHLKAYEHALK